MRSIEDKGVLVPLIVEAIPMARVMKLLPDTEEKQRVRGQELRKCL